MKALLCSLLLILPSHAQLLGAYTPFSNEDSATSWQTVDFSDINSAFAALWTYPGSTDNEIYTSFNQDFEVSLFADEFSSDGYFVGDYDDVGIDVVRCDVFVEDINTFSELEIYILSGGTFYYSDIFELDESGWAEIENSFTQNEWYIYDDNDQAFYPATLTPMILSEVDEIGVTFYPSGPAADGKIVALDNFTLLPDLVTPDLTLEPSASDLKISFTGLEGLEYQLQRSSNLRSNNWNNLGAALEITGPSETTIPLSQRGFFRLTSQPFFVEIP